MLQHFTSAAARSCAHQPPGAPLALPGRQGAAGRACRQVEGGSLPPVAPAAPPPPLLQRLRSAALAGALSAALALAPVAPGSLEAWAQPAAISEDSPVLDLARVVPSGRLDSLQQQLRDLERCGGGGGLIALAGQAGTWCQELCAA